MNVFIAEITDANKVVLDKEASHHLVKVLRASLGDEVWVTNGKGTLVKGTVIELYAKKSIVEITERKEEYLLRSAYLHLAIAPTKNIDRLSFFLEKATEIGVEEISLVLTHNSERKNINFDRLQKKVESAVKQSVRAYVPKLNPLRNIRALLDLDLSSYTHLLMAHCESDLERSALRELPKEAKVLVLIGPEGDFSKEEIKLFTSAGFKGVELGEARLRTETAALKVVAFFSFLTA